MGHVYFCSKCRYYYTSGCKPNSKECCQEKARILCDSKPKPDVDDSNELSRCKELLKRLYLTIERRKSYECYGCVYEHADAKTRYLECTNNQCYQWKYADEVKKILKEELE